MTAYWDVGKGEVVFCDSVDISVAVATEKVCNILQFLWTSYKSCSHPILFELQGLMTPIIRNADQKSISSISAEVKMDIVLNRFNASHSIYF